MSTAALKVNDLSVYGDAGTGRQKFVDHISFSIKAGHATGLVGESGCGKTMTALALLSLLPATGMTLEATCIEINGRDISDLRPAQLRGILGREIAMVFQQPGTALDPVFTLGQQIDAVYRRHNGGNKNAIRRASLDSLLQVGFSSPEKIASAYPHQLSGGMRQLAMIAMATVCKPAVLIADEPTTALDASTRALILNQLKRLQTDFNMAILLISHDLSVIRQSCRDVMVMYCGRIVEKADCQSLFSHPGHPYSAGLVACMPTLSSNRQTAIKAIPGQVPAPSKLPTGCHFAPRCEHSTQQCTQTPPPLETANGGAVACYRPL